MASQLRPEDKQRILKGVTKKVGDRPYENGYWGENSARSLFFSIIFNLVSFGEDSIYLAKLYPILPPPIKSIFFEIGSLCPKASRVSCI